MLSLFLSLALSANAVDATSQADAPQAKPAKTKPAKPKLICRSDTSSRSRMPTRVCKTQEDWDGQRGSVGDEVQTRGGRVGD